MVINTNEIVSAAPLLKKGALHDQLKEAILAAVSSTRPAGV